MAQTFKIGSKTETQTISWLSGFKLITISHTQKLTLILTKRPYTNKNDSTKGTIMCQKRNEEEKIEALNNYPCLYQLHDTAPE